MNFGILLFIIGVVLIIFGLFISGVIGFIGCVFIIISAIIIWSVDNR